MARTEPWRQTRAALPSLRPIARAPRPPRLPRPAGRGHADGGRRQTLVQALSAAYTSNPTLLAARANLRAVDEGVPQALSGWRPTVTVSGGLGASDLRSRTRINPEAAPPFSLFGDQATSPANAALVLSQPIYQGGRTTASARRAEALVLAGRARLLGTEQSVLYDAAAAYVAVLRDAELLRLNDINVAFLEQLSAATARRLRTGEVTRTDGFQAESRLATAQGGRAAAAGALEASRAAFGRIIGLEPQRLTTPQPLRPVAANLAALRAAAALENPGVVAALFDARAARDAVDLQVSLQAQAFRNDNPASRGSRTTGQTVTATLSVPIYQGGAEHSAVRQARNLEQQARRLLDDQRRIAVQSAVVAWETGAASRARMETARRAIRALEGASDGVQREALLGGRTTLDVLNAELELLSGRSTLVGAAAEAVTASYAAAAAVGRLTAADLKLPVPVYDWDEHYRAVRDRWMGLGN